MRLFKVYSATDGIHTLYSVSKGVVERSSLGRLVGDCTVIQETIEFSDADIMSLNKMHCLEVKTGHDDYDVLDALKRIHDYNEDAFSSIFEYVCSDEDETIIKNWLNKK